MKAIHGSTLVLGLLVMGAAGCAHKDDQSARAKEPRVVHDSPTLAEQRRIDERKADERVAEQKRIDERKADERAAADQKRIDERKADERERYIGGGPTEPNSAVGKIASARCEREVRCNNVGTKEKYSSRTDCVTRMQDDKRDDLNDKECPAGIDKKQLATCLTAIRDEACGNPLDTISRLVACRSSNVCLK